MNDPNMPEFVRAKYEAEGMRGTLCGFVRPAAKVHDEAGAVNCQLCRRELSKTLSNTGLLSTTRECDGTLIQAPR